MIELTLVMERVSNPEDLKSVKVFVNEDSFQMMYPEKEDKCAIIFPNGKSIVVEESYDIVKGMIRAAKSNNGYIPSV